jgi:16S rRNA processing protein RimM
LTEKFTIGLVGAPFGINGFVKVRPLSGEIDHLLKLRSVIVYRDGEERYLNIDEIASAPPGVHIKFEGINNPEAAKTLNGARLIVSREQAAPLEEGEFYIEDLKGLPVSGENGELIGYISDIIEGGGGYLAEIELASGEKRLIPFRKEFFTEISPEKGKIVLSNLWILE